jgi:DNA-binding transcriptional MerR regulator
MPARDTGLTIQQASEISGLSEHTLRYYERIGLLKRVGRAANGHRRYSETDINRISFLNKLRATGMSIRQMKELNELYLAGDSTLGQRCELLEQHQRSVEAQIAQLTEYLEVIQYKINLYREHERLLPVQPEKFGVKWSKSC